MTTAPTADIVADLRAELAAEKQARELAESEANALRPTVDISAMLFHTPDDVLAYFGDKKISQMVAARVAADNKTLSRQGYNRVQPTKEELAELTEELLQSLVDDRVTVTPPEEGWLTRTLKMVTPDGDSLRQIIYEGQVNNTAGSLADGILLYERKGFKRTDPMLCPAQDCWEPAAVITSGKGKGKHAFLGYCSEDHFRRTERGAEAVPGAGE